jgi:hypothetical protein
VTNAEESGDQPGKAGTCWGGTIDQADLYKMLQKKVFDSKFAKALFVLKIF